MRRQRILTFLIVLGLARVAAAQNKISGTVQCPKSDPRHAIEVGDHPNHSFVILQGKCTWTKSMEIAGTESKEHLATVFLEISGSRATVRGTAVDTMANGDKLFTRFQGSDTLKDEVLQTAQGPWSIAGGTGKLKGITGKGTYKGKGAPDVTATFEDEGEYELPTK